MDSERRTFSLWVLPMLVAVTATGALLIFGRLGDMLTAPDGVEIVFSDWRFLHDQEISRQVILSMVEMLAAVFAISITVVAIIVQLSATRYTSRVVDLFLADPFNILIFFAYVVPLTYGLWLAQTMPVQGASPVSVGIFMVLATFSTIVVIPYFKFVFHFLQPRHIIDTIERSIEKTLIQTIDRPEGMARARQDISNSVRQLSDIALSSIAQADILLAMQCLHSIKLVSLHYLTVKPRLPEEWHQIDRNHIVGASEETWQEMVTKQTWMEMDIFKQYEIAFTSSLRKVRDINGFVARNLREIAEMAVEKQRDETLALMIKAFNTLIMYALSERDIRAAVQVLYQYRLLGEATLHRPEELRTIGGYWKYYGENSMRRRIFFIVDAIACDLRMLIEHAHPAHPESRDALLEVFLSLKAPEDKGGDPAFLKGVRKSQAQLGGYFLQQGEQALADRILKVMATDDQSFLEQVRTELFLTVTREFWEIEDRGVSFFYVEPDLRPSVEAFFELALQKDKRNSSKKAKKASA